MPGFPQDVSTPEQHISPEFVNWISRTLFIDEGGSKYAAIISAESATHGFQY